MKWKLFLFNKKFQIKNKNYSKFHLSDIYIYIYIYIYLLNILKKLFIFVFQNQYSF
jgi:hypothetical protein